MKNSVRVMPIFTFGCEGFCFVYIQKIVCLHLNRSGESSLSFFLNLFMVSSMVLPILSLISPSFSLKGNCPLFLSQSSSHFPRLSLESYLSPTGGKRDRSKKKRTQTELKSKRSVNDQLVYITHCIGDLL